MKKLIALTLVLLMILPMATMASAVNLNDQTPIIYIRGNGEPLYNAQGERIAAEIEDVSLGGDGEDDDTMKTVIETAANILLPFAAEGLLKDEWDNYGKAVYKEFSPLFEEAILDGDGNPKKRHRPSPRCACKVTGSGTYRKR